MQLADPNLTTTRINLQLSPQTIPFRGATVSSLVVNLEIDGLEICPKAIEFGNFSI